VQVAAPTPHAAKRLLAVGPVVAKLLAVKTLGEGGLVFVRLYLDANVAEVGEYKYFRGFCRPWQGDKEQGQGNWIRTVRGPTGEVICLTLTTSKPSSTSPSEISCAGILLGRWRNTVLIGFNDIGKKVKYAREFLSK
jgi:hypothetical protein